MSTTNPLQTLPPDDLLAGAILVEERTFGDVFAGVCRRLDEAITAMRCEMVPVPCPDCRGKECRDCFYTGKRPFRYVSNDKRARLHLGIAMLEARLQACEPEETYWLEWSVKTLRQLLEDKYKGTP